MLFNGSSFVATVDEQSHEGVDSLLAGFGQSGRHFD